MFKKFFLLKTLETLIPEGSTGKGVRYSLAKGAMTTETNMSHMSHKRLKRIIYAKDSQKKG